MTTVTWTLGDDGRWHDMELMPPVYIGPDFLDVPEFKLTPEDINLLHEMHISEGRNHNGTQQ